MSWKKRLEKRPTDLNSVLFLIGVQELGKGAIVFLIEQKNRFDAHCNLQSA